MKRIFLTLLAILICYQTATAQTASDVLENGIPVESGEKIFLQYDNNAINYVSAKSLRDVTNPPDFTILKDSTIFLLSKKSINVYLLPLNPLNFSCNTVNKVVIDPINEAATIALGSIFDVLGSFKSAATPPAAIPSKAGKCDTLFHYLDSTINTIQRKLNDNQKSKIVDVFNGLKSLTFIDEKQTIESLLNFKSSISDIENYFKDVELLINKTRVSVNEYDCHSPEIAYSIKYIFNALLKDLSDVLKEQKKRLENLQSVYNLVEKAQKDASIGGGVLGLRWCIKLGEVSPDEGKISIYTITIKDAGYKLSDSNEVGNKELNDILVKTIRLREFQLFVPEVSIGTAFTFFKYNTYGTRTDSTGQQYVASPTENTIRNLNYTAMINFNYYIPNSLLHPLWQIGVGI
ncbi:MAG: hypothetical protein ABSG15_14985, partial [FCB group bacterium]